MPNELLRTPFGKAGNAVSLDIRCFALKLAARQGYVTVQDMKYEFTTCHEDQLSVQLRLLTKWGVFKVTPIPHRMRFYRYTLSDITPFRELHTWLTEFLEEVDNHEER